MAITKAKVLNLHWDEKDTSVWEASLEVEHEDGSTQMFVIPIVRMTNRIKNADSNSNTDALRTKLNRHRREG